MGRAVPTPGVSRHAPARTPVAIKNPLEGQRVNVSDVELLFLLDESAQLLNVFRLAGIALKRQRQKNNDVALAGIETPGR